MDAPYSLVITERETFCCLSVLMEATASVRAITNTDHYSGSQPHQIDIPNIYIHPRTISVLPASIMVFTPN